MQIFVVLILISTCVHGHIHAYMHVYASSIRIYTFVRVRRVVSYSHEDLVPEVALGGDGGGGLGAGDGGVHAEAGVVGSGGVGEGRHGGVGGREVVVGAAGGRRPAVVRRHQGPARGRGRGRPGAVGRRVHIVAPPGGRGRGGGRGRRRGGRRRGRRRRAGDGGLGALLRHALHARARGARQLAAARAGYG